MPRPRIQGTGRKVKVGVSLDPALYAWVVERTGPGKEFSTITHALERGIASLRDKESTHTRWLPTKDHAAEIAPARRAPKRG